MLALSWALRSEMSAATAFIIANIFVRSSLEKAVVAALGVALTAVGAGVVGAALGLAAVSEPW